MGELEELYTYAALLETPPDLDTVPEERWQELKEGIQEEQRGILISHLADKLDLYWPKSGRYNFLTVSDCLVPTFRHLMGMKSMGKKKAITILLVLTYLHETPEELDNTSEVKKLSPHQLLTESPDKWRLIINQNWEEICQSTPKNSLRKTIQELANDMGLDWPVRNWGSWTVNDCLTESFEDLRKIKGVGKKKLETIANVLIRISSSEAETSDKNTEVELLSHPVITNLTERERAIFKRRLLTVYDKPTLEELGQEYKVSRERIRQVESGIKKKIATSGLKDHLKKLLNNYVRQDLLPAYTDRRYILRNEVPSLVSTLKPDIVIAISLNYNSFFDLLSTQAKEASAGWYFGKRSEFNKTTRILQKELGDMLPAPTECLADKLDLEPRELIAVSLLNQIAVSEGVLMLPHRTGRADANRAARCFETAVSSDRRFWPIDELIEKSIGPLSPQNQRLYRISISRAPRLFISTPAYVSQLDHSIQTDATIGKSEQPLYIENEDIDSHSDNGNLSTLRQLLDKEWPITSANIREYTSRAPYQTDLSDNSLIVSLCSIPGCTRLAPGIYGPKDYIDHPAKLKKARKLTMDEGDIRAYCFARRAGENCEEIFPLWDAHQEQLWFRKLQKKREDDPLLRSFISVANQKKWPEQLEVETLKLMEHTVSAKFLIEPSWINARSYNVPSLATTLTALRFANEVAPLSWIRANHITCVWQLTEESGVSVLICGLVLGLLDSTKRPWWKPIPASNDFDANWERIESLFMEKDIPDWDHPVIQEQFETARELAADKNLGFIKSESLDHFINALKSRTN